MSARTTGLAFSAAALSVLFVNTQVNADQLEALKRANNNLAQEYTECAAYFLIVSMALQNSDKPDLAAGYAGVSKNALHFAGGFSEIAGLLPETLNARLEIATDEMVERIARDTSNISILNVDYALPCQAAMEDMESRVSYWLDKESVRN